MKEINRLNMIEIKSLDEKYLSSLSISQLEELREKLNVTYEEEQHEIYNIKNNQRIIEDKLQKIEEYELKQEFKEFSLKPNSLYYGHSCCTQTIIYIKKVKEGQVYYNIYSFGEDLVVDNKCKSIGKFLSLLKSGEFTSITKKEAQEYLKDWALI